MKRALLLLLALFACGESDPLNPPPLSDVGRSVFPCEPECSHGFACDAAACAAAACIPACAPICPQGTVCQPDGSCAVDLGPGPGEDFERNSRGGLCELDGVPGTECEPCSTGRWLCETDNLVTCAAPVGLNACGVCGDLPGLPSGLCADESRWACNEEGGLNCVSWFDANPCLGTIELAGVPGRPCGECHEGYFACEGRNSSICIVSEDAPTQCGCNPETDPPVGCGTTAGRCYRGVRLCERDGLYDACASQC
jgi:hypothetical protein